MEQNTFTISRLWDGTEDASADGDVMISFGGTCHHKQIQECSLDIIWLFYNTFILVITKIALSIMFCSNNTIPSRMCFPRWI